MGRRHPSSQPTRFVRVRWATRNQGVITLATFPSVERALAWARIANAPDVELRPSRMFLEAQLDSATRAS